MRRRDNDWNYLPDARKIFGFSRPTEPPAPQSSLQSWRKI
jgi:hypothetical protein